MSIHKTESGLSLLGGALIGAAVMYFLDPETGKERREHAGEWTGDAMGHAKDFGANLADRAASLTESARSSSAALMSGLADRASDHWGDARDAARGLAGKARDSGSDAADSAHGMGRKISSLASGAWDRASHWGSHASDAAGDYSHGARHRMAKALDPAHVRGPGHALGYSAAGVGTVALGAGLMYFLDPGRGGDRRTMVKDQVSHIVGETGTAFRRTGQRLMERFRGMSGQMTSRTGGGAEISGERLLEQCRGAISSVLARPTDVQLMADAGGVVTIYGSVPASEVDRLISTLTGVTGVSRVVNRVDVRDYTGGQSSAGLYSGQAAPKM